MPEKRVARGDELLYGYRTGDLVEIRGDDGTWEPATLTGTHRRQLTAVPLDGDLSVPWLYANPTRVRRLSPDRLEEWLEKEAER